MFNLTDEQAKALTAAIQQKIEADAKESVKEFDKLLDAVVDKLEPEGWTLPMGLTIYAINVIGKTDKITDINGFLKWYFSQDNYKATQEMVDSILASNIKNGLKKMTSECWSAFQNGLYAICSISLLSIIEGILSEFSEDKQDTRMMKVCQKQVDTFPIDGETIEKHIWVSYNRFIRNLYQKSDFNSDEPNTVNRHWLLHGRSDFEIDELDCIRLFNAVVSLCSVVNKDKKGNEIENQ